MDAGAASEAEKPIPTTTLGFYAAVLRRPWGRVFSLLNGLSLVLTLLYFAISDEAQKSARPMVGAILLSISAVTFFGSIVVVLESSRRLVKRAQERVTVEATISGEKIALLETRLAAVPKEPVPDPRQIAWDLLCSLCSHAKALAQHLDHPPKTKADHQSWQKIAYAIRNELLPPCKGLLPDAKVHIATPSGESTRKPLLWDTWPVGIEYAGLCRMEVGLIEAIHIHAKTWGLSLPADCPRLPEG